MSESANGLTAVLMDCVTEKSHSWLGQLCESVLYPTQPETAHPTWTELVLKERKLLRNRFCQRSLQFDLFRLALLCQDGLWASFRGRCFAERAFSSNFAFSLTCGAFSFVPVRKTWSTEVMYVTCDFHFRRDSLVKRARSTRARSQRARARSARFARKWRRN